MANAFGVARNIGCCAWRYCGLVCVWTTRFVKLRYWNCKVCKARRELDQCASRLGIEIYSLHQAQEPGWAESPRVRQALKSVEEAESELFKVQDAIQALETAYRAKRQRLSETCATTGDKDGD